MRGKCDICGSTKSSRFYKTKKDSHELCCACHCKLCRKQKVSMTLFEKLPQSIFSMIANKVDVEDLINLRRTNREVKEKVDNFTSRDNNILLSLKTEYFHKLYLKYKLKCTYITQSSDHMKRELDNYVLELSSSQSHVETIKVKNIHLINENKNLKAQNNSLKTNLRTIENMDDNSLNKEQERLFRRMIKHKQKHSSNNLIEAKNIRGPSKLLTTIVKPRTSSNNCSKSTMRARTKEIENLVKFTSKSCNKEQILSLKKRNKSVDDKPESLSLVAMKYIKTLVPWNVFRTIHTVVKRESNFSIMNEQQLRKNLTGNNYEYNQGVLVYENDGKELEVPYIRNCDMLKLIKGSLNILSKNGRLVHTDGKPPNTLWFLLTGI